MPLTSVESLKLPQAIRYSMSLKLNVHAFFFSISFDLFVFILQFCYSYEIVGAENVSV